MLQYVVYNFVLFHKYAVGKMGMTNYIKLVKSNIGKKIMAYNVFVMLMKNLAEERHSFIMY